MPVTVTVLGTGKHNAVLGIKSLLESPTPPNVVISVGYAAALKDNLRTGDLVVSRHLYCIDELDALESDRQLVDLAQESLNQPGGPRGLIGDSVTVPQVVASAHDKEELADRTDALIANMEDYWIAREVVRRDVPFLSIRVVLDTVSQNLPPFVAELGDKGRSRQVLLVLANVLRRPASIPPLVRLARQSEEAQKALAAFIRTFVPRVKEAGTYAILA